MTPHDSSINLKINQIVKTILKNKNDSNVITSGTVASSSLTQS